MKKNNLKIGITISGFLLFLLFVLVAFFCTFSSEPIPAESSSSISEVEELIVEETTSTETSTDVSTETTTYLVDETTITTLIESTTTNETTTETSQEQTTVTSQLSTTTSAETITEIVSSQTTTITTPALKSIEEIAKEVWQGLWGAGCDRKNRLEAAGYDYNEVQKAVDEIDRSKTTELTSTSMTTTTEAKTEIETTPSGLQIQFVKTFTHGTYYAYGGPRQGGSGRQLIDCSQGEGGIKGSIASRYLYDNYGYNYNGKRTMVYLEIEGYPRMNGFYYLDDSNAAGYNDVIDFFFLYNSNCPFQYQGVVKVDCSIVI